LGLKLYVPPFTIRLSRSQTTTLLSIFRMITSPSPLA
jgi:hypothetical protein